MDDKSKKSLLKEDSCFVTIPTIYAFIEINFSSAFAEKITEPIYTILTIIDCRILFLQCRSS